MTLQTALSELAGLLGSRLSTAPSVLRQHGSSETHIHAGLPDAVAYPQTTQEVSCIAAICADHAIPMTGWGAGTSLEGHALAVNGGIIIDFSQMHRVLSIRSEDMVAIVQPGITGEALNIELRDTGLYFPVDPGANATIGGMAATRGLSGPILGHVGDGNFHAILLVDPSDPAEHALAQQLAHRMAERALQVGGTLSGEHGIGIGKLALMNAEHGGASTVMGRIKQALDPDNLMNPGGLVPQS